VRLAERTINGAENTVDTAVKTAEKVVSTAAQSDAAVNSITARFAGENPIDDITRSVARRVGEAVVGEAERRVETARQNFGGWLQEQAGNFLNGARSAVENVVERGVDAGRSLVNGTIEGLYGFGRSVVEGLGQTITGFGEMLNPAPLAKVFQGDFSGAWNDFKNNFSQGASDVGRGLIKTTVQAVFDTAIVGLSSGVSAIQTLVGLEPPSRALNSSEIATLQSVYGDTIDYSQIRLKEGFIGANQFLAPHTVGNTIYIPQGWLDPTSADYQANRNQLLVHETAHVWQYQTGGTDYIGESLYNQAVGAMSGGDRGAAYNFEKPIQAGKSWAELNPEQQAHLIEEAYVQGLFSNPNARLIHKGNDFTDFARTAIQEMLAGRGAA
jgi:hypothetical protein